MEDRASQDRKETRDRIEHIESLLNDLKNAPAVTATTPDSVFKVPAPNQESSAAAADAKKGEVKSTGKRSGSFREAPLKMRIIAEPVSEKKAEPFMESKTPQSTAFIPAGSILTGTILTGGDFPTSKGGMENPTPLLVRISKEAILPNRRTSDIRECFLLMGGRGDLSSERVKLRGETLSCICDDGSVIETRLNSFLAGEDGKEGIRGRLAVCRRPLTSMRCPRFQPLRTALCSTSAYIHRRPCRGLPSRDFRAPWKTSASFISTWPGRFSPYWKLTLADRLTSLS